MRKCSASEMLFHLAQHAAGLSAAAAPAAAGARHSLRWAALHLGPRLVWICITSIKRDVCTIDASPVILQMPLRRHLEGGVGGGNLQNVLEHDPLRLHAVRCARCI